MGTAASSAKQNPSKGPRQYLFTADVDVDLFRNENKIKITGPVEVVPDMLLYAERAGVNSGELLPYRSNQFGYLVFDKAQHLITQPVHLLETQNFIVPPMDMLNLSWSLNSLSGELDPVAKKESWHNAIISHITGEGFDKSKNSIELKLRSIPFAQMRKPKKAPKGDMPDLDKDYRQWHDDCTNQKVDKLQGYFIPRVRMVFCVFNNLILLGAEVSIYNSSGKLIDDGVTVDAGGGAVIAVLAANKRQLPANETYKVEIDLDAVKGKIDNNPEIWNEALVKSKKYQFQEILTFSMGSRLGEYDVVMCDPITVEETLLQQFPKEYEHISRYIKGSPAPENTIVYQYRGRDEVDLYSKKGLDALTGHIKWAGGKAGMISGILSSDSGHDLALKLSKAINEQAAKVVPNEWKNGLNLAFQSYDVYQSWKGFPKKIAGGIAGKIDKAFEFQFVNGVKDMQKAFEEADQLTKFEYNVYKLLTKKDYKLFNYSGKSIPEFADKGLNKGRELFLYELQKHANETFDLKEMPPVLGNRAKQIAKMIDKVTSPVGWVLNTYAVGNSWYDVCAKNDLFTQTNKQFKAMLMDYLKKSTKEFKHQNVSALKDEDIKTDGVDMTTVIPSREGIINLEKFRSSTVMAGRDLEQAVVDAAMETFDFALSVGMESGYPPAVLACAIVALVKETVVLIGSAIDYLVTLPLNKDEVSKIAVLNELRENSSENQDLMPDSDSIIKNNGIDDLNVQFRMRAEAFYGLAGLITRASASASEYEAKKIQKKLDEIAELDQKEKDLGDKPDINKLQKIKDERDSVIKDLAEFRNEILKKKVEKYKIKEYIQEFILKDGWVMPVKDLCTITLDTLHLFGDESLSDGNVKDALIERNSKYDDLPALPFYFGAMVDALFDHELKANFSKAFPVHNISADSVLDLVKCFRMVQPEILRSDPVEYTCIFYRDKDMTDTKAKKDNLPDNGWKLINETERYDVETLNEISVLSQIRIFVLLKNDPIFAENLYPFELQLSRVDGWNIGGPLYKGMVHSLDPKQLLTHELKMSGLETNSGQKRFGVILNPSFQFGPENLLGTKPMDYKAFGRYFDHSYLDYLNETGVPHGAVDAAGGFAEYCKRHQVVGWEIQIGNTTDYKRFIRLGRPSDAENSKLPVQGKVRESLNYKLDLDEYRIKIDDQNPIEKQFLDSRFLLSRAQEWEMPKILDGSDYVFGIMIKLGDNPFVFLGESHKAELESVSATNQYNKNPIKLGLVKKENRNSSYPSGNLGLVIQNYDWKTPIEFMVLIRAGQHVEENGKYVAEVPKTATTNLNWKNCIKLGFNVAHEPVWKRPASHKGIAGPDFENTLYYLGKRDAMGKFTPGQFDSNKNGIAPDPRVDDAYDLVEKVVESEKTEKFKYPDLLRKLKTKGISHQLHPFFEEKFHFFAAHVKPSYTVPDGDCTRVDSLRPFAANDYIPVKGQHPRALLDDYSKDELEDIHKSSKYSLVVGDSIKLSDEFPFGYYEYYFENFATSDGTKEDSGQFNQSVLENCLEDGRIPFKIMIEAPENNYKDVPWEGLVKNAGDEKAVDAWITNNTKSVGVPPSVQEITKKQATNNSAATLSSLNNKSSGSNATKASKSNVKTNKP